MPSQTLLSFRAGKMYRENDTSNTVLPDERKGYIQLLNEDDLLHFQWKERSALDPEDDLIIFPDDAKFVRVTEAVDGRVYMLCFESSKAKHFFWMQDKSDARDMWLVERLNTLINDPDAPAQPESPLTNGHADQANAMGNIFTGSLNAPRPSSVRAHQQQQHQEGQPVVDDDILNSTLAGFPGGPDAFWEGMNASGINRDDLLQMLSSDMHPALRDSLLTLPRDGPQPPAASVNSPLFATQPPPSTTEGSSSLAGQLPPNIHERLAELTAGLPGASGSAPAPSREYLSLNHVLNRDVLGRLLTIPGIAERLRPGLPENWEQQGYNVADAVQSPQFQQALSSLSSALGTGQLAPLLQQFGLAGQIDDVESFLRAVEEQVRREQQEGRGEGGDSSGGGQDPHDGDRMQED